jgi:hypothetical protein
MKAWVHPDGMRSLARFRPSLVLLLPLLGLLAMAQDGSNGSAIPSVSPKASGAEASSSSQDGKKAKETQTSASTKRRGHLVIAPIPVSSPAVGSGVIPVVGYIFPVSRNDTTSPPSVVGAAGLITDNGSRAFAVAGQFFIKEDTYHASAAFFQGNLNYDFYGIGITGGDAEVKLPLKQDGAVFLGEFQRRMLGRFFIGPRVIAGHSVIMVREGGSATAFVPPGTGLHTRLTSVGIIVNRDTRPNRFYPTSGTLFNFTADFFANAFGSKYSFQSYRAEFNKYGGLSPKQVLAYNAFFCATGGEPPFYGNCIYGTRNELRGYEAGRYLDRYLVATQLEYRLVLPKRFGVVVFGGIGGVAPGGEEFFRSSALLPAGGAGLRFMLSKSYHVNLRADLAVGKNEHTFSMGISEAF